MSFFLLFTFVWHHVTCLEIHLGTAGGADLVDVVTELVAAVLSTAETKSLVEGLFGVAAVSHALLLDVQQRVNEQVDGALMGTLDKLVHICSTQNTKTVKPHVITQMTESNRENVFLVIVIQIIFPPYSTEAAQRE